MRIAIATVRTPFVEGGSEAHATGLRATLQRAGHDADIVTMPFRFQPEHAVRHGVEQWLNEDFTCLGVPTPDRVICLRFPAYYLKHPEKTLWLLHQHRTVYDEWENHAPHTQEAEQLRALIHRLDTEHLAAIPRRFANSQTVAGRLQRFNGISSTPLYHPPPLAGKLYTADPLPYVFAPSRLERHKRQILLIEAMRYVTAPVFAIISGSGGQQAVYESEIAALGLEHRVRLIGELDEAGLLAFYAHSFAVFFGPRGEDLGYITLEAMLARKPVITCHDSGGPLEFVRHRETGLIADPEPRAIAQAIDELYAMPRHGAGLGSNGYQHYESMDISWDTVAALLSQ